MRRSIRSAIILLLASTFLVARKEILLVQYCRVALPPFVPIRAVAVARPPSVVGDVE